MLVYFVITKLLSQWPELMSWRFDIPFRCGSPRVKRSGLRQFGSAKNTHTISNVGGNRCLQGFGVSFPDRAYRFFVPVDQVSRAHAPVNGAHERGEL